MFGIFSHACTSRASRPLAPVFPPTGAVLGLFHAVGFGAVGSLALSKTVRDLGNTVADRLPGLRIPKTKTNEEDVPSWWRE